MNTAMISAAKIFSPSERNRLPMNSGKVYQCGDWENSKGALIEYGYALGKGMKILSAESLARNYEG